MKFKVGDIVKFRNVVTRIKKVNKDSYFLEKHTALGCPYYYENEVESATEEDLVAYEMCLSNAGETFFKEKKKMTSDLTNAFNQRPLQERLEDEIKQLKQMLGDACYSLRAPFGEWDAMLRDQENGVRTKHNCPSIVPKYYHWWKDNSQGYYDEEKRKMEVEQEEKDRELYEVLKKRFEGNNEI